MLIILGFPSFDLTNAVGMASKIIEIIFGRNNVGRKTFGISIPQSLYLNQVDIDNLDTLVLHVVISNSTPVIINITPYCNIPLYL